MGAYLSEPKRTKKIEMGENKILKWCVAAMQGNLIVQLKLIFYKLCIYN